jgi:hypothetical protein
MNNEMKSAMEIYFTKLHQFTMATYGANPSVPYSDTLDRTMLLSVPDEEGYVEWIYKLQTGEPNWAMLENKLGFTLNGELRAYYSTYLFLEMSGKLGSISLHLEPLKSEDGISELILRQFLDAQHVFPGREFFLIGNAAISDDDGFFVHYDNRNASVLCHEQDTEQIIPIASSLTELISEMNAYE